MSSTDTYLYLIRGSSVDGTSYLEYNDDGGTGLNSRISRTLAAGTYTVAATTYGTRATSSYTLRIN